VRPAELSTRPEILREPQAADATLIVEKRRSLPERVIAHDWVRKLLIVLLLGAAWQAYASYLDNDLLFPTLAATLRALADATMNGTIIANTWGSLRLLLMGLGIGVALAALFTTLAIRTRFGADLLETLAAMFNPLPALALLPLALLWFGVGSASIVFVVVHSVLWAVALNANAGFRSVSPTLKMVGHNYQLGSFGFFARILVPAAFPSILAGLQIGWAFAWRTLIGAELVFGVSSGGGGLGWFIYSSKNQLDIASVFAGLLMIILIGLVMENVVFRFLAARTVRRWGMVS